jgi:hypothetical protein
MALVLMLWIALRHGCLCWQRAAQRVRGHRRCQRPRRTCRHQAPFPALTPADTCTHPAVGLSLSWCRLQIWSEVKAEKAKAAKAKAAKEHSHSDKH